MKEIKPTYITFEQAKWLKEKEWQQRTKMVWLVSFGKQHLRELHLSLELNNAEYDAPEQWQVVEWLRVNHGIWVESLHRGDMGDFIFKVVELNENNWKKHPHYIHNEGFNSPQEAYSAAFDYIKDNNLI
jgi:hypothetical protein